MNKNSLDKTHQKLSLIFTGLMFGVVMILGGSFLFAKYAGHDQLQKRDFDRQVRELEKQVFKSEALGEIFPTFRDFDSFERFEKMRQRRDERSRVSFFVLNAKTQAVIFKNLLEPPHFDLPKTLAATRYIDDDTYVAISELGDKTLVVYQEKTYTMDEFLIDILGLLLLSLLFSLLFYYIGSKFVKQGLIPVEENLLDMKNFIHNAGHELKTPLAIMRGNLQIMQAEKEFDPQLLKASVKNIDSMNSLIEGLRELSEVGSLSQKENLALVVEVKKCLKQYEGEAQKKNISIEDTTHGSFVVFANRNELGVLLSNIILNAIRYNKQGGSIKISLQKNILSVSDSGVGMSEQEQEKILDRFFQGAEARSGEGFGIGLSLVKKIADNNKWKLKLQSSKGEGTEFQVIF